jgi:hypothetical protein
MGTIRPINLIHRTTTLSESLLPNVHSCFAHRVKKMKSNGWPLSELYSIENDGEQWQLVMVQCHLEAHQHRVPNHRHLVHGLNPLNPKFRDKRTIKVYFPLSQINLLHQQARHRQEEAMMLRQHHLLPLHKVHRYQYGTNARRVKG